mgnify:FL=1|jgi:hypothetical protein
MAWYLIVIRNGQHFFATRRYFEKHFVEQLAKQLHETWPDAKINMCYVSETTSIDTLYDAK